MIENYTRLSSRMFTATVVGKDKNGRKITEGAGAYVTKKITSDDEATYVTITVTSNDLKTFVTRTVTFPGLINGINKPQTVTLPNGINAIYNLAGQQVSSMASGNVYIVKTTDGKTKKVVKK